ncbi:putative disease resistance RPP13-like protein 1 [Arachis hypogaea]|uniref:putative disease resistance RPP13-like protein 1 n=2 Tax=Arachis hypogaea TaxID=3818 RepID=UPI0010FC4E27|nr:putative disease resistance protein At3g14460 [Arachis hypogaea]XP_025631626.2 putative disease resistance protein At3g14460 [Arachis hypogaea]QHO22429.1 Putative disease resistance RPP13-like protein [Arachis hypogaea]
MAGPLFSGGLVSGLANVVLDRLSSHEFVLVWGNKLVERLRTAIRVAEDLAANIEQEQFGNELVRKWLDSFRDALYTANDLLDDVLTKAATQKVVRFWRFNYVNPEGRQTVVDKMQEVVERIEELAKRESSLGLIFIPTGSPSLRLRPPSTSLVKRNVFGRDGDQQALIKMLNDNNHHNLSVISIVGMAGVGKTTLAQCLYNNMDVRMEFDLRAWICVSEHFDVVDATKNIIKRISWGVCSLDSFDLLQQDLKEKLLGKKFFIVLDDVWSEDADKWNSFITPFQHGRKGSTILLTTRKVNVGSGIQNCNSYPLEKLSDDYCWSIFADNVFFPKLNGSSDLERIGRKIVEKCDGLPLAAETLGSFLRAKHDAREWNKILSSNILQIPTIENKVMSSLLTSYYHLPTYLKQCFIYCSLFPKDYYFDKDELILLWMAEDLLPPQRRRESLEEIGCKCFDELVSRLFFRKIQFHHNYFVMDDILHELAIHLAGEFHCNLENLGENEEIKIQTRYLSFGMLNSRNSIAKLENLTTSLCVDDLFSMESIASNLKNLRVLSFCKLDVLPEIIGELIRLRYLNLSWTNIKTLPESLCNLYNLQTLMLYECTKLTMLPSGMHKLVKLRHLDVRKTPLKEMPGGISKLENLQFLSSFVAGKHEDNGIQEVGGLANLHGSFEIKKLENVVDVSQGRSARIIDKTHIDELCLEWSSAANVVQNTETERDILESLQAHDDLKVLKIKGYKGTTFPDWLGHSAFTNMTSVSLVSCNNCFKLPSLGELSSLKSLRIERFDQLRSIGMELYKNEGDHHSSHIPPFPSLETLEFHDMPSWEEWHLPDFETFPQLQKLQLTNCPMLKGDMLNGVFLRMVSSLSDGLEVRKLHISEVPEGWNQEMILNGYTLSIKGCVSVVDSAFKAMSNNHLSHLQEMHISGCWSGLSFPGNSLPRSLQKLKIMDCRKLEFPQQQPEQKYDLVELQIEDSCHSLTSLSLDSFPNLTNLEISLCLNLESVSMSEPPHAALQRLTINGCHKLVSFAGEGLAAPNLTHLSITYCDKLEAFPSHMNTLLPSLHSLCIGACRKICKVPEGGFPPNLKELVLEGSDEQMKELSWMANLGALTKLTMDFSCVRSFTQVGLLPCLPSLTTLHLCYFQNLETLECNQLLGLTSLQQLHISYCPKLEKMEGEKLPSSLSLLKIQDCDLLGELCKNKHEPIWPKISHIPTIEVNGQQISE